MMPGLHTLPEDVLHRIGDHLSQQDMINLSMTTKYLQGHYYPRRLTKFFEERATVEEYIVFLTAVVNHPCVQRLYLFVNPAVWNNVAPALLMRCEFERVSIFPSSPPWMDRTCWIPKCTRDISGFLKEPNFTTITYAPECITVINHRRTRPERLPHFKGSFLLLLKSVRVDGPFMNLERIPRVTEIELTGTCLTRDKLYALSTRCRALNITRSTLAEDCMGITLQPPCVHLHVTALRYIERFEGGQLFIDCEGELPSLTRVYDEDMHITVIGGNREESKVYLERIFPQSTFLM
jgi:hypothetical protein